MRTNNAISRYLTSSCEKMGMHVLLAVETGSRAHGLASDDSDHDVGLIFVRQSLRDYFRVDKVADHVRWEELIRVNAQQQQEFCIELDIIGWDIMKAAHLLRKGNPSLQEWLNSPVVYVDSNFAHELRVLVGGSLPLRQGAHSYLSQARSTWDRHIAPHHPIVDLKEYVSVLRSVLCVSHILDLKDWPPTRFTKLLSQSHAPQEVLQKAESLGGALRAGQKLYHRTPVLDEFIRNLALKVQSEDVDLLPIGQIPDVDLNDTLWRTLL